MNSTTNDERFLVVKPCEIAIAPLFREEQFRTVGEVAQLLLSFFCVAWKFCCCGQVCIFIFIYAFNTVFVTTKTLRQP